MNAEELMSHFASKGTKDAHRTFLGHYRDPDKTNGFIIAWLYEQKVGGTTQYTLDIKVVQEDDKRGVRIIHCTHPDTDVRLDKFMCPTLEVAILDWRDLVCTQVRLLTERYQEQLARKARKKANWERNREARRQENKREASRKSVAGKRG